jgi:hypothetical protein
LFALVSRPFLDSQEDFMDITCRVVNMCVRHVLFSNTF